MKRRRLAWMLSAPLCLCVCVLGCGGAGTGQKGDDTIPTQPALAEVAELVKQHIQEKNRPPARLQDLEPYEPGLIIGYEGLKRGAVVLFYGASITANANTVLAYEKDVPTQGGYVLMQNGTVKRMTAEEFKKAPKAGR